MKELHFEREALWKTFVKVLNEVSVVCSTVSRSEDVNAKLGQERYTVNCVSAILLS